MTLDEAIQYAEDLGKEEENKIDYDKDSPHTITRRKNTVKDYRQLAEWLRELVSYRKLRICCNCRHYVRGTTHFGECHVTSNIEPCVVGADQTACDTFFDYKEEYANLNKISYGYYKELKEAKRLLKMAVEDLSKMPCNNDTHSPDSCYICVKHGNCSYADSFKWCKADIALKLIGGTNEP